MGQATGEGQDAGTKGPAGDTSEKAKPAATDSAPAVPATSSRSLNLWAFLSVFAVMAALVAVVVAVVDASKKGDAAATLGVIIPVFASIAAAMFGIPLAYKSGTDAGTQQANSTKEKEVAAAAEKGAKLGQSVTAQTLKPVIKDVVDGVQAVTATVHEASSSPQGSNRNFFGLHLIDDSYERDRLVRENALPSISETQLRDLENKVAQLQALADTFD